MLRFLRTAALVVLLPSAVAAKPGAPANDTCTVATPITALPFNAAGTTVGATDDLPTLPPGCSDLTQVAGPDVIYTLDVGTGNTLTFAVAPAAGYDAAIYLLGSCGDGATCQKGADPGSVGATETFSVSDLTPGTYAFYVDSYYSTGNTLHPSPHQGSFTLTVTGSLGSPTTATTTTTITSTSSSTVTTMPGPPLCVGGAPVSRAAVRIARVGGTPGDEGIRMSGVLDMPAGVPADFDPAARGAQLMVADLGGGPRALVDMTARTTPIPPGASGTGCGRRDGWRGGAYRNRSNAFDPPGCPAGSAHGLRLLRLKDKRSTGSGIAFKAVLIGATVAPPVGPLGITLVLGAEPGAGLAGECGTFAFTAGACRTERHTYRCH